MSLPPDPRHPPLQHLQWGADALWEQLAPLLPGIAVEIVARCESTNTRLLDRARESGGDRDAPVTRPGQLEPAADDRRSPYGRRSGDTQPVLLVAEHQTRGRGRLGRDWQARPGLSLTFSLSLPYAPADWAGLSLAVGVALADALEPPGSTAAARIALKWPNDLWLLDAPGQGRKLGGILIETVPVGARRMCVVGVGLNVLPREEPEPLANGYASLSEIDAGAHAPSALACVAPPLVRALRRFEQQGFAPLQADFARRDLLAGRRITTTLPDWPEALALGVDPRGGLMLRADDGREEAIVSGEVSVRLQGGEPALPPAEPPAPEPPQADRRRQP